MAKDDRSKTEYYDADTGFLVGQNRHCEGENGLSPYDILRRKVGMPRPNDIKSKRLETSDVSSHL